MACSGLPNYSSEALPDKWTEKGVHLQIQDWPLKVDTRLIAEDLHKNRDKISLSTLLSAETVSTSNSINAARTAPRCSVNPWSVRVSEDSEHGNAQSTIVHVQT
jgi:hypothetical protein